MSVGFQPCLVVETFIAFKTNIKDRAFGERCEVTRTKTLADFLQDGAVFDDSNEYLDFLLAFYVDAVARRTATGNAVLAAADEWEDGCDMYEGDFDARKVLEHLEDASARTGCIVEEFVSVYWVAEFLEAFFMCWVGTIMSDELKEIALGDGCDVKVMYEKISQGAAFKVMERRW